MSGGPGLGVVTVTRTTRPLAPAPDVPCTPRKVEA